MATIFDVIRLVVEEQDKLKKDKLIDRIKKLEKLEKICQNY
jgi:hypothetical protein